MQEKDLGPKINLSKIPFDKVFEFNIDLQKTEWIQEITDELEELTDTTDENYQAPKLAFNLHFKRRKEQPIGDHLIVWGDFECDYITPCVRCLTPTAQHIAEEMNMGFISSALEKTDEFKDEPCAFISGEERDLYFHEKGFVNLIEALREQVFVHADFFPLHHPDCKGLCPECGIDKNIESCPH